MTDADSRHFASVPPPPPGAHETGWSKGFVGVCAGFLLWGLGHWIAGQRRRGAFWFGTGLLLVAGVFVSLIVPSFVPALLILLPLYVVLSVAMLIDAFVQGRRSNRAMLGGAGARYAAGMGMLLLAVIGMAATLFVGGRISHDVGVSTLAIKTIAMEPTLMPHDRLLAHRAGVIRRWDLVIFRPPNRRDLFTQRVVGLPGEKIEIVEGRVQVNDRPLSSPSGVGGYVSDGSGPGCTGHPIRLGADEYFVLGDNSPLAYDSRRWPDAARGHQLGAIPAELIVSRVTAICWPIRRLRKFQ